MQDFEKGKNYRHTVHIAIKLGKWPARELEKANQRVNHRLNKERIRSRNDCQQPAIRAYGMVLRGEL
jgi:hypothetical protein